MHSDSAAIIINTPACQLLHTRLQPVGINKHQKLEIDVCIHFLMPITLNVFFMHISCTCSNSYISIHIYMENI